jgi:undecaprenyl phosphate N,N'-diacetylbacillosamine 1-phosphate transferase
LYKSFLKPFLDFIVAFVLLILLSPVIILTIFLLFFTNRGKVFFTQMRPGKNGQAFSIIKFKTMTDEKDGTGNLLPDEMRLSKVGKKIRAWSIDELLQLVNVLKGEMSLVGPRPLLMDYLPRYSVKQAKRHDVRPGITGLAQVNGRNAITWDQKFEYDLEYVEKQSFMLDCQILLKTLLNVIRRKDINSKDHATMGEFLGK